MKNLIILSISILSITCFSCDKKEHSCQSRKMLKEHESDICEDYLFIYQFGVCGCDGKTYSTPCAANKNGMEVDYEGACK